MKSFEIISVTPDDLPTLRDIAIQTFSETFSPHNTEENISKYLEREFSEQKLAPQLTDNNSEFYFAVSGPKVIGFLKINTGGAQTEIMDGNALEIERIYVLKEYHGKNIGQLLFEKAVDIARKQKADFIWLGVWEKNHRALNFYKKNGFVEFGKHTFRMGDEEQTDLLMKLELKKNMN
ncbi:MAG: GNAT family N-acetyltransferase [Ignavibacteriaceae bacterium]|nr:GNAT family N-acetyltransferase [Ignavibacteriaceae bacterium]